MTELELKMLLNEKICDIADALMNYYDICGMKGSTCKVGKNPCCIGITYFGDGCPFLRDNQCHFRNAGCKLWFCETALKSTNPKCIEAIKILKKLAVLYELTKGPLIGQPYVGADKQS